MNSNLTKSYDDGFLLTEKELRNIFATMELQLNQVATDIAPSLELTFANGIVAKRPSLQDIFSELNGGDHRICRLTIYLQGKKQTMDTGSILLIFSSQDIHSITLTIEGNDENWIENTGVILEKKLEKIKKFSFNKLANQVSSLPVGGVYVTFADIGLRLLGNSPFVSDYIFAWGESLDALNRRLRFTKSLVNIALVGILLAFIVGVAAGIMANYLSALLKIGAGH